jgi:hypothetical protein
MRRQEASKRQFARSNMAAAAAGGCLRQRGGAEAVRVGLGAGNELRCTGSRVALKIASVPA